MLVAVATFRDSGYSDDIENLGIYKGFVMILLISELIPLDSLPSMMIPPEEIFDL